MFKPVAIVCLVIVFGLLVVGSLQCYVHSAYHGDPLESPGNSPSCPRCEYPRSTEVSRLRFRCDRCGTMFSASKPDGITTVKQVIQ